MEDAGETLKLQSSPSLNNSTPAGVGGRLAVLRAVPTPRSLLFPDAPQRWSAGPGRCCARICAALHKGMHVCSKVHLRSLFTGTDALCK